MPWQELLYLEKDLWLHNNPQVSPSTTK
jgi:hypothetical protein